MKEFDREHDKDDSDLGVPKNRVGTCPLGYDRVVQLAILAIKAAAGMAAMTFSPRSNRIYDLDIISQALALFWEIIRSEKCMDPSLPIYLIGITCHTSAEMDHIMKKAYIYASRRVSQPLIGTWTNSRGEKYLDVVIPMQFKKAFNSDARALEVGKKYEQAVIIKIEPDGNCQSLETY